VETCELSWLKQINLNPTAIMVRDVTLSRDPNNIGPGCEKATAECRKPSATSLLAILVLNRDY